MIIEFCKYGSVESCYRNKKLTDEVKLLMCYDCAMGMNVSFLFFSFLFSSFTQSLFFLLPSKSVPSFTQHTHHQYLHQNDIIHRDLKPDNLLVVSFSKDKNSVRAKLSDFGTSRSATQTMQMTESIGTPVFMAPEVFDGTPYGKKSDVYSFGMTAWSIFAERIPYFLFFFFPSASLFMFLYFNQSFIYYFYCCAFFKKN